MNRRDFLKNGGVFMAALELGGIISLAPNSCDAKEVFEKKEVLADEIKGVQKIPTVCLNCSTVCGMNAIVKDGKLLGVEGNDKDPNSRGKLCAKGHGGVSAVYYPERIVYPLKRVGKRGDGLWQRVTMEEAYELMASKIKKSIEANRADKIAFHAGRNRIADITGRFMDAIGSPIVLNHRALCSSNKRAANYATIGDTDWESVDAQHCKYFLNFGSNFLEAHQGGFPMLQRYVEAKSAGAKLVTFDVRLSNTAGKSDEWLAPFPSSEGAIALAMAHEIIRLKLYNKEFIDEWVNVSLDELESFLKPYTPEFAEKESGIEALVISRLAVEFASAAPACAAFTNRGSQAHQNGFNNDRAVIMLNMLVGSVGQKGGYCFGGSKSLGDSSFPAPLPIPPKPSFSTELENPKAYPLANRWQKMKVGEIVYDLIKNKNYPLDVYISYTISSPHTWPESSLAIETLKDEKCIAFHVCSDIVYSQMAHYADLILPDATYFERYAIEGRNSNELIPYFLLRQPVVKAPYDCEDFADTLIKVAKRLGEPISKYFEFNDYESFIRLRLANLPQRDGLSGFDYMKKHGVWVESAPKNYEPHKKPLSQKELEGSFTKDGIVYVNKNGKKEAIGLIKNGLAVQGVKTPGRKYEIFSSIVSEAAKKIGEQDDGWPSYKKPLSLALIDESELVLTTFKWNVHTQARTAPQKYLSEIVHDNPVWINSATAKKLGVKNKELVEIVSYRPKSGYKASSAKVEVGRLRVMAFVTEGIHPKVVAISASLGMEYGGRVAMAKNGKKQNIAAFTKLEERDMNGRIWWDTKSGGSGAGYNPNGIIPINPSPLVGMQSWNDTICKITKIKS